MSTQRCQHLSAMSTPAAFDTTLLVPAASAGSQPSGPRSPWSPVRQAPRSVASPIIELAEMEGGRTATCSVSTSANYRSCRTDRRTDGRSITLSNEPRYTDNFIISKSHAYQLHVQRRQFSKMPYVHISMKPNR